MDAKQKPLVVVPADVPVQIADSPHLDRLRAHAQVRVYRDRPADDQQQLERLKEAEILLNSRNQLKWEAHHLDALPRLKMIATCSIGTDSIDLEAAARLGIVVSNIPGKTAPVVAEHVLALILAVAKRVVFQTDQLRAGHWSKMENLLLAGKTLGIIGTGAIGSQVARLASAIGMRIIAWTFHPSQERAQQLGVQFVELDQLLAQSDVVSLHVKLTDESRGLLGRRELSLLQPHALLINAARGALVDMQALVEALQQGRLGGAGLDVFDIEPLPADHPILSCQQVVLTPHTADQTPEGIELLNEGAVDNVLAFLHGQPENVVA